MHVRLPGRPNGHKGWIRTNQTRRSSTEWRLGQALDPPGHRLPRRPRHTTLPRRGRQALDADSHAAGSSSRRPLALSSGEPGGPFALATSARSNVLQEFEGGPGQIALHGTNNLSGALGTAVSHGCIRLSTSAITWLASRIGSGVPLTIRQ